MERRMRKHGNCSPERFRGRGEPPPPSPPAPPTRQLQLQYYQTHQHHRQRFREASKVPVVYYICSDRHLEQPHFVEVPISSSEGLYLKDVINRLNVLRGKGMAAMYSWSCKRSYKNGFVWHDLSVDDLILPAHGNEYVLKGSDLLDVSLPERSYQSTSRNPKLQNSSKHHLPQQEHKLPSRSQDSSQCSIRHEPPIPQQQAPKTPSRPPPLPQSSSSQEDELCSTSVGQSCSSNIDDGSPALVEFRVSKPSSASDASTQTDERSRVIHRKREDNNVNHSSSSLKERSEIDKGDVSPPPTSSSTSSSGGKTETLESLIRTDALKTNSFRILEEEEVLLPTGTKVKATNVLMQLITCGSISVKGHQRFGIVPTYKPRFSNVNIFPSPMFRSTMTLGELDCLSDSSRFLGLRLEAKERFSGSLIETKKQKEVGQVCTLKRSSPYNSNRSSEITIDNNVDSRRTNCLPRTIKISSSKQSKNDNIKSPVSDCPRISSEGPGSKRFTDTSSSSKGSSRRLESFKEDKEKNVIKIDERLTSGARITIQSTVPCDDSEGSSGS